MHVARLALTVGEPAGIGPDICLELARRPVPAALVAIGDLDCLRVRAARLGWPMVLRPWDGETPLGAHQPGQLFVLHTPLAAPCRPGQLNPANSPAVLQTLDRAVHLAQAGLVDAIVTAPVHKGVINDAGVPFTGHTEYLAERTGVERVVMLLAGRGLRVALATTHLPLSRVAAALNREDLQQTLRILHRALRQDFGILDPRILVAGLNPHAGEGGHLGREEIEVIEPALQALRREGLRLKGPLPADTLFTPRFLEEADAVLAMYHDQGLPVLKYHAFGEAVNISLGLPIIRTSVDHGTALELAATGRAESSSLAAAVEMAIEIVRSRRLQGLLP
ncbi:MAG: 4-hydroxythreonine-4-phosphate dehydrogenase PdxA [Pseudomonadota bacterium]